MSRMQRPGMLPVIPQAPLVDGLSRAISYLRVSLTDRCNYRCTYCMPEAGVALSPRPEVLTIEEIAEVVTALVGCGVRRVRLTGGEPTIRGGLVELVSRLSQLPLDDLAMTTNGHLLRDLAAPLHRAGLQRLNVSLDSLDAQKFHAITRWGDLDKVVEGIEAAHAAGFQNTKLNVVALAGFNDDEFPALCEWSWARGIVPRFIEWMPMSEGALFAPGNFISAARIRAILEGAFGPLVPAPEIGLPGVGPARYHSFASAPAHRFGLISAVTEQFCDTCNRVRLSATGKLHTCLARDEEIDLRAPLRAGHAAEDLISLVRGGVAVKAHGHDFTTTGCGGPRKHMVTIGG